jgi:hypothetical protein
VVRHQFYHSNEADTRIRAKEVTLTYKLPLAWRTPPSGGKNLRKEEFFTQEHLVEPMGVEPTTSRVRFSQLVTSELGMSVIFRVLFFLCSITSASKNVNNGRKLVTPPLRRNHLPLAALSLEIRSYQFVNDLACAASLT